MKSILAILFILLSAYSPTLSAVEEPAPEPKSVIIAPFGYVRTGETQTSNATFYAAAERYITTHSGNIVRLVDRDELRAKIQRQAAFTELLAVAREWSTLGTEKYKQLDVQGATTNLERALDRYEAIGAPFVVPQESAGVLMYLALSYLEADGDVMTTLDAMKKMILLDPARELRDGFYPTEVVQFYKGARATLEKEIRERGPLTTLTTRLSKVAEADFIWSFAVVPEGEKLRVFMHVFDTDAQRYLDPLSLIVANAEAIPDATNRLASQFVACLEEPTEAPRTRAPSSRGDGRWSMQLNFAYASFFDFPELLEQEGGLVPFANIGGNIGVGYAVTKEFTVQGSVQLLQSLKDRNGVLLNRLTSLRGFGGPEIGIDVWLLRLSVAAMAEFAFLAPVELCLARDIRQINGSCDSEKRRESLGFLGGVNLRPRVAFNATNWLDVFAGANGSFYVFPLSSSVNFPIAGELGLQYRF